MATFTHSDLSKVVLTAAIFIALVGLALLASHIPAIQALYLQISGSLLGLMGLHHGHDLVKTKIGTGDDEDEDEEPAPDPLPQPEPAPAPAPPPTVPAPDVILTSIMPHCPAVLAQAHAPAMSAAAAKWDIQTPQRMAMWLANCALECNELREMQEEWGPSAAQLRYEPPSHVASELGNTQPGDGKRFLGRGVIQITGRDNYRRAGAAAGVDLVDHPQLAVQPSIAWDVAGWYWSTHGLNAVADRGDFVETVKRINGGTTDLAQRQAYYARAQKVLGLTA